MKKVLEVTFDDTPIGLIDKMIAHKEKILHRAFSVFIIDLDKRKMLIQRRSNEKYHSSGLLTHCSFKNTKCVGVDFCNTNLKNTSFCGAVLKNVMFFNCNLKNTNFKNAIFENVVFVSTNLNNAKNLVIDNNCLIYSSYPQITIPYEFSAKIYDLNNIPQIKKYNVLFVKGNKLNLWILKILMDMFGEDVYRALMAIQRKKRIEEFYTLFSYIKHIEKYLQV